AIIDGPNFAHHIYQEVESEQRASNSTSSNTIGPLSTYADYATKAIEWMDCLEQYGVRIGAVIFDGALPAEKRTTRYNRLTAYAKNLDAYRARHEQVLLGKVGPNGAGLLHQSRQRLIPAFLVAAVQEALVSSRYSAVTYLVPGEADPFCVAAARDACEQHPAQKVAIFSNDSDLVVYPHGKSTRIVALKGLSWRSAAGQKVLLADVVWPASIAGKLHRADVTEIAFHFYLDPQCGVNKARSLVEKGRTKKDQLYRDFAKLYCLHGESETYATLLIDQRERQLLQATDARVSELICQVKDSAVEVAPPEVVMSLPFLLDDPLRATAWNIGTQVRQYAYEMLFSALGYPRVEVSEYRRSRTSIVKVPMTEWKDIPGTAPPLSLDPRSLTDVETLPVVDRWRMHVAEIMLRDMRVEGMSRPSLDALRVVLQGQQTSQWPVIHLSACYQAAYYSWRILAQ
ncbi:hypothetical protein BAUCODRAFT_52795, partial [Baudoinia panamericana UAMH 10762]